MDGLESMTKQQPSLLVARSIKLRKARMSRPYHLPLLVIHTRAPSVSSMFFQPKAEDRRSFLILLRCMHGTECNTEYIIAIQSNWEYLFLIYQFFFLSEPLGLFRSHCAQESYPRKYGRSRAPSKEWQCTSGKPSIGTHALSGEHSREHS